MQGDLTYKLRPQDYLRMDAAFVQKVQVWQLVALKFGKMNDRYDETERKNSMSAFYLRVIFLTLLVASDNIYVQFPCLQPVQVVAAYKAEKKAEKKRKKKKKKKKEKKARKEGRQIKDKKERKDKKEKEAEFEEWVPGLRYVLLIYL